MKFMIDSTEYDFDGEYTVGEAMLYQDHAGLGIAEIQPALARGNPYVMATLMYILKKRAGEAVRWQDMRTYNVNALRFIPEEDKDLPANEVEQVDPTQLGGQTPENGTDST